MGLRKLSETDKIAINRLPRQSDQFFKQHKKREYNNTVFEHDSRVNLVFS